MLTPRTKKSWKPLVRSVVSLAVLMLPMFTVVVAPSKATPIKASPVVNNIQAIKVDLPTRLEIPAINVTAPIVYEGLTSEGAMDIKKDPTEVAWYKLGPRPGEKGSAVIAGHYGFSANGEGSVFNGLHTLNKGDKISVIDNNNTTTNFVVRESRRYSPKADATDVFISNDGKSHLNLITCDGIWENDQNTYSNRLVVFADKE